MNLDKLKGSLTSDGAILRDGQRKMITKEKFKEYLIKTQEVLIKQADLEEKYMEAVKFLYTPKIGVKEEPKLTDEEVASLLDTKEIFKNFFGRSDGEQPTLIYYRINENKAFLFGSMADLDHHRVYKILTQDVQFSKTLKRWQDSIRPYAKHLKIRIVDSRQVVEAVWATLFNPTDHIETVLTDFKDSPALLQGYGQAVEYTIPFIKKHSTLGDLGPTLSSFLSRVSDHKHLCAIIASRLVGFKWDAIPWIYGKGGEGKSTFTKFLGQIVPNGSAEIRLGDPNGLWEAIGKTFLIFPDTSDKNLIYHREVKNISGGDPVSIVGKYKAARTQCLTGLIIITSNKLPNIGSDEAIIRRTRVFSVEPAENDLNFIKMSIDKAVEDMKKYTNEFLNYCLQCLEEVGNIITGEVKHHPTNKQYQGFKTLQELEFEDFIKRHKFVTNETSSIGGFELRALLRSNEKEKFFMENFIDYVKQQKRVIVTPEGDYVGIGHEQKTPHIHEIDRIQKIKDLTNDNL